MPCTLNQSHFDPLAVLVDMLRGIRHAMPKLQWAFPRNAHRSTSDYGFYWCSWKWQKGYFLLLQLSAWGLYLPQTEWIYALRSSALCTRHERQRRHEPSCGTAQDGSSSSQSEWIWPESSRCTWQMMNECYCCFMLQTFKRTISWCLLMNPAIDKRIPMIIVIWLVWSLVQSPPCIICYYVVVLVNWCIVTIVASCDLWMNCLVDIFLSGHILCNATTIKHNNYKILERQESRIWNEKGECQMYKNKHCINIGALQYSQ